MKKIEKEFEQINTFVNRQWERTIGLANHQALLTGWVVGSFVSARLKSSAWGSGTVDALVDYLKTRNPKLRGYGRRNIYNMVLFYDTYSSVEFKGVYRRLKLGEFVQTASAQIGQESIVQTASAQLPSTFSVAEAFPAFLSLTTFSNHLEILGRCRTMDERVFYILYAARERLNHDEMRRSIVNQTYSSEMSKEKLASPKLKTTYPGAEFLLKDKAFVDFLRLPAKHNEHQLHAGLREKMKQFILEMGKDFLYMGDEYRVQIGGRHKRLDLLFYHRSLQCLVDVELKAVGFQSEFVGKMDMYLEALDRDVRRPNENPSIGIILCPSAESSEVSYTLCRSMSPMLVAEYQRLLVPQDVMKKSLDEYCAFLKQEERKKDKERR